MHYQEEMIRLRKHLAQCKPGTDEFDKTLKEIRELIHVESLIEEEERKRFWYLKTKESKLDRFLSNAPLVTGVCGLLGMAMVISSERIHVITTRALGLVRFR